MFYVMDHTIIFAIDRIIRASDIQKLDQNIDHLKALFDIVTGHKHAGGPDDGAPIGTGGIAAGTVRGSELSKTVANSAAAQAIAATASWTPSVAGYYNLVADGDGVGFQLNVSGWKGVTDANHYTAGAFICDGSNMRLYNGDAAGRNISWQSF